jgi:hypothetical protein
MITLLTIALAKDDFWNLYDSMLLNFGVEKSESANAYLLPISITIVVIIIGVLLLFKSLRTKLILFAKSLLEGLFSIFNLQHPWYYIGHSILIWTCYIVMFALPYYALEETQIVPFEGILVAFIAGSLGISFTNGGIGTYPLLVGFVTAYYLGNENPNHALAVANALGMLIWASQAVIMVVMGLISLYFLPKTYAIDER